MSADISIYREHRKRMPLGMKTVPMDRGGCHERLPPLRGIDMSEDQNIVNLQSLQTKGGNH